MLSQAFVQLEDIHSDKLDLLMDHAWIQQEFAGETIWLGLGPKAHGDITFYCKNFFHTNTDAYTPAFVVKTNRSDLLCWLQQFHEELHLKVEQNLDDQYQQDVLQIQKWIQQQRIQKMVAITSESYERPTRWHPLNVVYKCLSNMPGTLYGMWNNEGGIIGMTPEPLFVCNGHNCYTFALAGTISTANENYQELLARDPKELSEHQMVIEDIKLKLESLNLLDNDLANDSFEISNIVVEPTQLLDYGAIAHLKTKISFRFHSNSDSNSNFSLVDKLSPTAALGGFPQDSASSLLKKTLHYQLLAEERLFGGTMGLVFSGQHQAQHQALVAIRNIQWDTQQVWIESGSGIVAQSDVNKELVEVQNKRNAVKKHFI